MFIGEFEYNIDEKGRLAIPKKFRDQFSHGLVLTRGLDPCLWVYTVSEWTSLAEKISRLPIANNNARVVSRMMFSGATDCQLDQQGRVVIPNYLREYARLGSQVTILGVNNRLEVWSKELWSEAKGQLEGQAGLLAEHLASLGVL